MGTQYYAVREGGDVLFAVGVSPGRAARRLASSLEVVLASSDDLQDLAVRRRKLLHVVGSSLRLAPSVSRPVLDRIGA
jgi:hypothetical protein